MNNKTIIDFTRNQIKQSIQSCTEGQQMLFKRMYAKNIEMDINDVIDEMDVTKLEWALTQIENTLKK